MQTRANCPGACLYNVPFNQGLKVWCGNDVAPRHPRRMLIHGAFVTAGRRHHTFPLPLCPLHPSQARAPAPMQSSREDPRPGPVCSDIHGGEPETQWGQCAVCLLQGCLRRGQQRPVGPGGARPFSAPVLTQAFPFPPLPPSRRSWPQESQPHTCTHGLSSPATPCDR